jgi:hypothetical protein
MDWLIWAGALVAVIGLAGIMRAIWLVLQAKRKGLDDAEMRARIQSVLPLNLGALFISAIGLMMVVVGILF